MSDPRDGIDEAFADLPKPILLALVVVATTIGLVTVPFRWCRDVVRRDPAV